MNKIDEDVNDELRYLLSSIDMQQLSMQLNQSLPGFDTTLFVQCINCMLVPRNRFQWVLLRQRLISQIKQFRRRNVLHSALDWFSRRLHLLFKGEKKQPATGGISIAIIGSDGSGKSTAINNLSHWLGGPFNVKNFHMGRPKPSLLTSAVSRLSKLIFPLVNRDYKKLKAGVLTSATWPKHLRWLPKLLYCTIARDRFRTFRQIQKAVGQGKIALIDRYPFKEIKEMDSPRIPTLPGSNPGNPCFFGKLESHYYQQILKPDVTALLVVNPETAATRQSGDGYEYVIRRASEVKAAANLLKDKVVMIDANQPVEQVQYQLRKLCWENI